MRDPRRLLWAAVLALLSPAACALDSSQKNGCHVGADCNAGEVCVEHQCRASGPGGGAGGSDADAASSGGAEAGAGTLDDAAQPAPPAYLHVSAGGTNTCVVRTDHTIGCWGMARTNWTLSGSGFVQVSVGNEHVCGLLDDGRVVCNGDDVGAGNTPAPTVKLASLANGRAHACGLDAGGRAYCWGVDTAGQTKAPPDVSFEELGLGSDFTCGLQTNGEITCWGKPVGTVPAGPFTSVAAGEHFACGVRAGGSIDCWGEAPSLLGLPPGPYKHLALGGALAIAQREDGTLRAWGNGELLGGLPKDSLAEISVGSSHGCGLTTDGALVCWGDALGGAGGAPPPLASLRMAPGIGCGITPAARLYCWGLLRSTAPDRIGVAVHYMNACSLDRDGLIHCEGDSDLASILTGPFVELAVGFVHGCARRADGTVDCWGRSEDGRLDRPAGVKFKTIAAGALHTCGIREDGGVTCWGESENALRQTAPAGSFVELAVSDSACALGADGSMTCWGKSPATTDPQRPPPPLKFSHICLSPVHGCGIRRSSGTVACWGNDVEGAGSPPEDLTFESLGCGDGVTCGLRPRGRLICWGHETIPDEPRPTRWVP